MFPSEYSSGYWSWNDDKNCLMFNKTTEQEKAKQMNDSIGSIAMPVFDSDVSLGTVRFRDLINSVSQAHFRRYYRRKVKVGAPDVVTIQDVKDVILFTAEVEDLTIEFVKFFHLPTMDAFLRAAVVYFQYFFQVWEHVEERREETKRKITQPIVNVLEDIIMENLGDLRSVLSREYHRLICGISEARKFYHFNKKNNVSTSDKDRRLFEAFVCVSVRVISCALNRKNFHLIESELNRLLRTKVFNLTEHRLTRIDIFDLTASERRYIWGKACKDEKKLKHRSPAAQELIFADHDYKMLAIGVTHIETEDPRQNFLEIAYTAPEEMLYSLGVGIGILGYPRDRLDVLLKPRERTKTDVLAENFVVPPFILPPKSTKQFETYPQTLPRNAATFPETNAIRKARRTQANIWIKHIEFGGIGDDISVLESVNERESIV